MSAISDSPQPAARPPKILIITFTFAPSKNGVAEAAGLMVMGYAERGYDVVVVTGKDPDRTNYQPHPNIRIEDFVIDDPWKSNDAFSGEVARMQHLLLKEKPDVLLCHCWEIWSTAIAEEVFHQLNAKKVLISHGYSTLWRPRRKFPWGLNGLIRGLIKVARLPRTIRLYDRVVFLCARQDLDRYLDHTMAGLIRYAGIRIIPNGTDLNPARSDPHDFRAKYHPGSGILVLYVSNYTPGKNQALALRAFRKARLDGATLVFIGGSHNDYSASLKTLDEELKTSYPEGNVVFLEKLDRPTTLAAYAACDVFLFTSISESGPIVILEAMSAGKPFITTDVGIVRELPGGIISNKEEGLAKALNSLSKDQTKRKSLGKAGRQAVVERYSREMVWKVQDDLIHELLTPNVKPSS